MRPWLGRSLISICDVLIEPRPEDAPGRLERLDLILRFLDEARHLSLDEETAWVMHGLHLKALRKLDRLDEAEQVFVRVGHAPDWGWLFAIEAVRLASLRRDREGFVARRAKALELYPGEQAITVIRAPR